MKKLLLCLMLACLPAMAANSEVQVFTASASGNLVIGVDGRVLSVELDSEASLGKDTLAGYEENIRAWRFEPIIQDGQPLVVKTRMRLSLIAARKKGEDSARFGVRNVWFLDPPGTRASATETRLAQPSYPTDALRKGAGAQVMLLVKLDAQGRPAQVTTEALELLGIANRTPHQANLAAQFRRSAERVATKWVFHGRQEGDLVRVPVRYAAQGMTGGWEQTVFQPVPLPEWAVQELALKLATDTGPDGSATAAEFKLLTPLDKA